jgi:Ca2+-binding RTX toxin-like protein
MANIIGTPNNDVLNGTPAADLIQGLGGSDILDGGADNDYLQGDGDDPIAGGNDTLNGGTGDDLLEGWGGDDTLYGGDGDDDMNGDFSFTFGGGNDKLYGGAGNDRIDGGRGIDFMAGGPGDDTYYVDDPGDVVEEASGGGIDVVRSEVTFTLGPNIENLILAERFEFDMQAINGTGNELDNKLTGQGGDNVLSGLGGNDALDGGDGFDTAVFIGALASYHFAENAGQVTVSGPDGTDILTNIEQMSFANLSFSIADRGHFDPLSYLNQNPDVAAAAVDPLTHYRNAGWAEGRDPNPSVDLASVDGLEYIASYGDLMAALGPSKANGLQHFATQGLFEGRTTTFDGLQYIASYSDLINAFHNQVAATADPDIGANHYIIAGYAEHRAPDLFDAAQYLANYADLQAAFGTNTEAATLHYITNGYFEERTDDHST